MRADLLLGLGTGAGIVPDEELRRAFELYPNVSKGLSVTAARAPDDALAHIVEEVHNRIALLFIANVNGRNLIRRRRLGQANEDEDKFNENLDGLKEQARLAEAGDPGSTSDVEKATLESLFEDFRRAVSNVANVE